MINKAFLRRLAYVKSLYNASKSQYKQFSDIEVSRSIITLDSCVEAYLWLILEKQESHLIKKINEVSLYTVLDDIKKRISNVDIISIKELHKTRNAIQHNGFLVARSQASRYFSLVDNILNSTCKEIFDITWHDVSLSFLIIDEHVRVFYQNAELKYFEKNYIESAKFLILAFEYAKRDRQFAQGGSGITMSRAGAEREVEESSDNEVLLEYTKKIEQELEVIKLDLDYSKWIGYRRELGNLNPFDVLYDVDKDIVVDEKIYLLKENKEDIHKWLVTNFNFVFETILMWENSFRDMINDYS